MIAAIAKHILTVTVSLLLVLALFLSARLFPAVGIPLGIIFLLSGVLMSMYLIVKKNWTA